MAFCVNCGNQVLATAQFCPECGQEVGYAAEIQSTQASVATNLVATKADLTKRAVSSFLIDGLGMSLLLGFFSAGVLSVAYALVKDCIKGRSIGRMLMGQQLVCLSTGRPAEPGKAIIRNLVALLCEATIIGGLIDLMLILTRPDGRRLADLVNDTKVVDVR